MSPYIVLQSVVALLSLWYCIYYLWRDYRLDVFREDLFAIRDRMFLYAAKGNIRFNDQAYAILRTRMNGMLRFGHWFTITRVVIVLATHREFKTDVGAKWEEALTRLPSSVRDQMEEFHRCVTVAVLQHLVYQSFFRYAITRLLVIFKNPFHSVGVVEEPRVVRTVEQLEEDALEKEREEHPTQPAIA